MVCIPTGVTSVEERAVKQASVAAGAKQAYLIEEPIAAALGAGIDISGTKRQHDHRRRRRYYRCSRFVLRRNSLQQINPHRWR